MDIISKSSEAPSRPENLPPRQSALRILLVEDHADTAESTAMILRHAGHEVFIAADGLAALQQAAASVPDVVLLDLGLPGMNGWEVARRLRSQPQTPRPLLIAVTGFGQKADRLHSYELGIDLHLTKPLDPAELEGFLARYQQVRCS
jgi:CheY-like chemotaxis protein